MLTQPYVTVAEFRAAPTWIDTDDLIPGGSSAQQDAELANVLLRASAWADGYVAQRLGAHTVYEQMRARLDRQGRIILHPSDVPVRQVTGIAYGADPQDLNALTDLSGVWIEDQRGIVVVLAPLNTVVSGSLQFGPPSSPGYEVYVEIAYVAGYACTTLASSVAANATSLTVKDGTGFAGPATTLVGTLGGTTARIWDPALEEAVQVASGYTSGSTTIPLTVGLTNAHAAGAAISEMPAEVRMAVITYAAALLLRDEQESGSGNFAPSLRKEATAGSPAGLIADAQNWLDRYRRVR